MTAVDSPRGADQAAAPVNGTYTRAILASPKQIVFDKVAIPTAGPGQVLVRVQAAALCTWEQRVYAGIDTRSYPLVGGHEFAGEVVAIGPVVLQDLQPGDQVAVSGLMRCNQCWACRRGYDNICDNQFNALRAPGEPWGPGGFSQYALAQSYQVFKFPRRVSDLEAALAEPLACVLHDVKRFRPRRGDTAVIVGAGIMGLLHLAAIRDSGARVVVSELDATRRAKALEMGADAVIDPSAEDYVEAVMRLTEGRGVSVTYLAIGVHRAIEQAVRAAAKRGIVSVYASVYPKDQTISLDPNLFHNREIVLSGSLAQDHEDFMDSVWSIAYGTVDLKPVLSAVFPLQRLEDAFAAATRTDTYRVFVTPNDDDPGGRLP